MKKIGLLSDTHGKFDECLQNFFADVDQIWHAGDIGSVETSDAIAAFKPLKAVCGNVDGGVLRRIHPKVAIFDCEEVKVVMTHIGGYPKRYDREVYSVLIKERPKIFISGHSHILKVVYDDKLDLLHINPGAAGASGFHKVRTAVRFVVEGDNIRDLEVGEWAKTY